MYLATTTNIYGWFEVYNYIGFPNEFGRLEVIHIHIKNMKFKLKM